MKVIRAQAKINLFFHITDKREDGYHLVNSLVVFAKDIYDEIEVIPANYSKTIIEPSEFSYLLTQDGNNLIDKADKAFSKDKAYNYHLTKNIPIGAGLGGGSSDASMVAKFLLDGISLKDSISDQLLSIGADLPICYYEKPAFVSGIGEIIEPIDNFPTIYLVLVNPKKALLTKDVFKINNNLNTPKTTPQSFANSEDLVKFLSPLKNDLTKAAIQLIPEIQKILNLIKNQEGCSLSRLSGSGPTCFGIFINKKEAVQAYEYIKKLHPEYWIRYSII